MKEKLTRLRRERQWGSYILSLAAILLTLFCLILLLAKIASFGAARIFNYAAARQDMLRGTITVESITANIHGGVTFTNLAWDDPEGNPILRVPAGSFKVNPWDVLQKRFVSTTLKEITLESPVFAVHFDEDMNVDFVNRKEGEIKQDKEKDRENNKNLEDRISNFNRQGKPLDFTITVHNARMEAFYRQRRYLMNHVAINGRINTRGLSRLYIKTGEFGGTMVGDGVEADCEINFKEKELPSTITVTAMGVDPSSMGLGDGIHDKMTLTASGSGPLAHPIGDGTVTAYGDYNIDSRAYNIYLHGEDLDSRIPTKEPKFYCLVTLDGEIHCDGDVKHLVAFGSFSSGGGFYSLIPFNGISGTFNNRYRALDFYDVTIDTNFGLIRTDAFHIIDGKLHLGTIELVDRETGKTMSVADARNREGPMKTIKQIQQNIKEIKEQAKNLKP